jgi:hypothetical protein
MYFLQLFLSHIRFSLTHYSESGSGRENRNWKKTGIVHAYFLGYFPFIFDEKPYSKVETTLVWVSHMAVNQIKALHSSKCVWIEPNSSRPIVYPSSWKEKRETFTQVWSVALLWRATQHPASDKFMTSQSQSQQKRNN